MKSYDENNNQSDHPQFQIITIRSWNSARSIGKQLFGWVFRGVSNSEHNLQPVIERFSNKYNIPSRSIKGLEGNALQDFKRRSHHFSDDLPEDDNDLEWLALMRHWGGPTRLLDFTLSFYIAAYFAVEKGKYSKKSTIWAINLHKLSSLIETKLPDSLNGFGPGMEGQFSDTRCLNHFIGHNETDTPKLVIPVQPVKLNRRMAAQQGVFLMPLNTSVGFMDNLLATFGMTNEDTKNLKVKTMRNRQDLNTVRKECAILKIILPDSIRKDIFYDLERMNINACTIYPDLTGLAARQYRLFWKFEMGESPWKP